MAAVDGEPANETAAYFKALARRYRSLAVAEPHAMQSALFATIAADYAELADDAVALRVPPRPAPRPPAWTRCLHWLGYGGHVEASTAGLPFPPAATGVK